MMASESPSIAKRLARRTTDIFAIAILAVGTLAISGRLTEWWSTDPESVLDADRAASQIAGPQTSWGSGENPVALRLGQLPVTMHRQVLVGEEDRASKQVLQNCRSILVKSIESPRPIQPLSKTEQELLDRLKTLKPLEESANQWQIFRVDEPGVMMVGTLMLGVRWHRAQHGKASAQSSEREILCWGMATPSSSTQWTLFTFEKTGVPTEVVERVPLPPQTRLVLTISDPSGGQLASFESSDVNTDSSLVVAQWREFFDQALLQSNWQLARPWTATSNGWSGRYEQSDRACELLLKSENNRAGGLINLIAK